MRPLTGIRVIDLSRLAPGPFATMWLADLGAEVIEVAGGRAGLPSAALRRGKVPIVLDLKSSAGQEALALLVRDADVLVEGFRPGVAERLGADHVSLLGINPRLVHCSLTGYGQTGPYAQRAGHDINYVGLSGLLGALERPDRPPLVPLNLLADFAGGGMQAMVGILAALVERGRSGLGQHVDVSMTDGVIALMAHNNVDFGGPAMPARGAGLMSGEAPFYRTYRCQDDRYVAVGALETAFWEELWAGLGLPDPPADHMATRDWPELTACLEDAFAARTRDQWMEVFESRDACVTPVLDPHEARRDPQHVARGAFTPGGVSSPIPRFSRTPGEAGPVPEPGEDRTAEVLAAAGAGAGLIREVLRAGHGAVTTGVTNWPPYTDI